VWWGRGLAGKRGGEQRGQGRQPGRRVLVRAELTRSTISCRRSPKTTRPSMPRDASQVGRKRKITLAAQRDTGRKGGANACQPGSSGLRPRGAGV
jgi:hypothetical protein